ncbi:MAG: pseudouridine synthase [Lachnospiraceae bacterium]|nr:pseudouridine synthase [Lachnospiraceae bacterium]
MRLDKYLSECNLGTRTQVKEMIRKGEVSVGGKIIRSPQEQIDPEKDQVCHNRSPLSYEAFQYYVLYKPAGVVSATKDQLSETVLSLLPEGARKDLFPVGRLDKDTEGLLLISNDGALAHNLLSPKRHVAKTYLARIDHALGREDIEQLEQGVDIGDDKPTMPAFVTKVSDPGMEGEWIHLTICEGRFHQVKRMLEAIGNRVLYLRRIRFGALSLDPLMRAGECRALKPEEVELLRDSQKVAECKHCMLEGKKAVIFDLDGSLVDSMWIWSEIDKEYLGRFGITLTCREEIKSKIEGMSFHETAIFIKEAYQIPDSIEQMKADWNEMAWDKYEKEVPLKPGIPDFLEGCKRRGLRLGIATSNSRELAENVLRVHGLMGMFSSIMTGSEVLKGKPAPDIYLKVAKELDVDPSDCLVFEDILPGINAGKNAGMTVCAVADEDSHDNWEEKKATADHFIFDYFDFH